MDDTNDFDVVEDLIFFINNDPQFYKNRYYPELQEFQRMVKKGMPIGVQFFAELVNDAYRKYTKMYDLHDLPEKLSKQDLHDICGALYDQEVDDIEDIKQDEQEDEDMNEDINRLKMLAGVTGPYKIVEMSSINSYEKAAENAKIVKEQNIKPGTKEWFDTWFPLDVSRFPASFRGRK